MGRREDGEHHLGDVEGMSPVVVRHVSVVLLHAQQPPAEHLVVNVKPLHQIQVQEHPQTSLQRVVIVHFDVIEAEIVELEEGSRWHFVRAQSKGVVNRGRGVIAEHLQRHTLLRHRHYCLLVHVRIVDSHPAKDGKRLHKVLVVLRKGQVVEFVHQLNHADYLPVAVLDRHAQNRLVLKHLALVHAPVEPIILVRVRNINCLRIAIERMN